MAEIRELAAGQQTSFPAGVLRARLTGSVGEAILTAVNARGDDVTFRRVDPATVLVHPGAGSIQLMASPRAGIAFEGGTRLGIDVRLEGAQIDSQQVLIQAVDVGALAKYELAQLALDKGVGWTMRASAGRTNASAGLSLERGVVRQPIETPSTLDEQQYPWISAGRYAFRGSRGGSSASVATAASWALVLDGSVSMRTVFTEVELSKMVELVAGILSEWTGRIPIAAATTGLTSPVVMEGAASQPSVLVASILDRSEPPSWSIVTPAIAECVARGAQLVVLVTDGAPADTRDLAEYTAGHPEMRVLVVAVGVSAYSLPSDRVAGPEELGALADLARSSQNLQVIAVGPTTASDNLRSIELAHALTSGAR